MPVNREQLPPAHGADAPKRRRAKNSAKPTRQPLPTIDASGLSPREAAFVAAYRNSNFNASAAYKAIAPHVTDQSAGTQGYLTLKRHQVKDAILHDMQITGVTTDLVSKRIKSMLVSSDPWSADRGVTHARAILGLDAPSESHHTVDSRSVTVVIDSKEAAALMKELIAKTKG
jgi:hypothetical protein